MTDNALQIRTAAETRWDCAALGEVMLRFDPGFGRVRNARSFQVWEGGGEYNVARAMRKCWGKRATAVTALQKADLLIALGARFDDRVTGKVSSFAPEAKVIHVDIDPAEQGKVRRPDVPIVGDCRLVIEELVKALRAALEGGAERADTGAWRSRISGWQEQFPYAYEAAEPGEALKPQFCLETLRDCAPAGTILVSGEEKLVKPDPRIFQILIERTGVVPQRTVFIDDSQKNAEAAARLGFQAIRFTDAEALRARLIDLDLLARDIA